MAKKYTCKPPSGLVEPYSEIQVLVSMEAWRDIPSNPHDDRDKLQVISFPVTKQLVDMNAQARRNLFKRASKHFEDAIVYLSLDGADEERTQQYVGLEVEPTNLKLKSIPGRKLKGTLTLRNHSDQTALFKVRTNMPRKYTCKPALGILDPWSEISVKVAMRTHSRYSGHPLYVSSSDKFQVLSVPVTNEMSGSPLSRGFLLNSSTIDSLDTIVRVSMDEAQAAPSNRRRCLLDVEPQRLLLRARPGGRPHGRIVLRNHS